MDRGAIGRIEGCRGFLHGVDQRLDDRRSFRPTLTQAIAPSPRLGDDHLGRRGLLRNDRQAMQFRRQPRRLSQQLRFSVIHNFGQEPAVHPRENQGALLREVGLRQTESVMVRPMVFGQGLGVRPHLLAKVI